MDQDKKKRILFLTNYCGLYTGFGMFIRELMTYIYKNHSNNYEIALAATGQYHNNPEFQRFPWQIYGVMPIDPASQERMRNDTKFGVECSYGKYTFDKIVSDFKPDCCYLVEDSWGNSWAKDLEFTKHIPTIYHITLDSLPILDEAIEVAKTTKYYWTWSSFSSKRMVESGLTHVTTQFPCIQNNKYKPLEDNKKQELRKKYNIPNNAKIFGYVFRNQPRKLVNKLIEGFSLFQKQNPDTETFLLLHTSYHESGGAAWNIPALLNQYGVKNESVLCTYVCRSTKEYYLAPFQGEELTNPFNNNSKTMFTVDIVNGVSTEQLNEIYNIIDLYFCVSNSGSTEMPIIEAALAEKPIACPKYSYGEDVIDLNKGSFEIIYDEYTEPQTQFIKANCRADSIRDIMINFCKLTDKEIKELGQKSRKWALENYSTEINAKKILDKIDSIPKHNWNFEKKIEKPRNPEYQMPEIADDVGFILDLYKNILGVEDENQNTKGCQDWLNSLKNGVSRQQVYDFFIDTAKKENLKIQTTTFVDLIDKTGRKTLLLVIPESGGDIVGALGLLNNISVYYPNTDIYFSCKPQFAGLALGNRFIYKVIPYDPSMENEMLMIGSGSNKGYFDYYIRPAASCQKFLNYLGNPNIQIETSNLYYLPEFPCSG